LLRTHVSGGSAGGDRADSVHYPLLRSARGHFRDDLVLHAGRSRFPVARQRSGHGRGCLVGAYRRVSRRLACNATPAKARRRLSPLLSRRGHLWLSAGWPTGRRTRSMDIMQLFWLFFIISALQPVLQRRYLEAMRARKIASIEKKRASRVILLIHRQETMNLLGFPLMRYIDVTDSEEVLRAIQMADNEVRLDIVLHTPGGLGLAATQFARAIQGHKGKVTVFVPHYAMSGGTLIALAADEIVMCEHSVLGPVDPQLGQLPAASLIKVVEEKPIAEIDDQTLIMADVGRKAIAQIEAFAKRLLSDKMD